jgi:hypothetical protein
LKGQSRLWLFNVMLFMFTLATVYWIISIVNIVEKITVDMVTRVERKTSYRAVMSAIIFINVSCSLKGL